MWAERLGAHCNSEKEVKHNFKASSLAKSSARKVARISLTDSNTIPLFDENSSTRDNIYTHAAISIDLQCVTWDFVNSLQSKLPKILWMLSALVSE
ncbi:hypothetical protein TNCV_1781781 [Trichonephila clavipes]|nr:hypothetical protein TNCV_1781781 [Trichonephila clavipes]